MGERGVILERIARMLAATDIKTLAAIERIISTYINALKRREVR
jgi:hypothetical protein